MDMDIEASKRWFFAGLVVMTIVAFAVLLLFFIESDEELDFWCAAPETGLLKIKIRQLTVEEVETLGPIFSRIEQFVEIKKSNPLVLPGSDFKKSLSDEFDPKYFSGIKLFRICFYDSADSMPEDAKPFVSMAFLFDQENSANLYKRKLLQDLNRGEETGIPSNAVVFYKGKVVGAIGMLQPAIDEPTAAFKELVDFIEKRGFIIINTKAP